VTGQRRERETETSPAPPPGSQSAGGGRALGQCARPDHGQCRQRLIRAVQGPVGGPVKARRGGDAQVSVEVAQVGLCPAGQWEVLARVKSPSVAAGSAWGGAGGGAAPESGSATGRVGAGAHGGSSLAGLSRPGVVAGRDRLPESVKGGVPKQSPCKWT
jgi:hypothetical protein